jgi:hypothetical protein
MCSVVQLGRARSCISTPTPCVRAMHREMQTSALRLSTCSKLHNGIGLTGVPLSPTADRSRAARDRSAIASCPGGSLLLRGVAVSAVRRRGTGDSCWVLVLEGITGIAAAWAFVNRSVTEATQLSPTPFRDRSAGHPAGRPGTPSRVGGRQVNSHQRPTSSVNATLGSGRMWNTACLMVPPVSFERRAALRA